jgi:hypothetical protein
MTQYQAQTTAELIALLFQEQDRVTVEHIQELVARPDATTRLIEILGNEEYWYEGRNGEWWITMHAITILALKKDLEGLPILLNSLFHSWAVMNDWVGGILPSALAQFGEQAVPPLIEYILTSRDKFLDDDNWSYARSDAAKALTIIALEHPVVREMVLGFLCALFNDATEEDQLFLSFAVDCPIKLDPQRGLAAVRNAYAREMIEESIQGTYQDIADDVAKKGSTFGETFEGDLLAFYQPEEIQRRQRRWKNERDAEAKRLVAGPGAQVQGAEDDLMRGWDYDDDFEDELEEEEDEFDYEAPALNGAPSVVPAGYRQTGEGNLIKTADVGRNDPCPCGSGKKYKKCCGS